ncbi:MAG: ABC transporter [Planctomycetes bacterium RBG_13_50_24]|nr:MAG: ABC transporter [Planctomycetes bacterium RBG_13_50_24]
MTEWEIEFDRISKSFFGARALSEVSFSVGKGRTLGLIGENGAGKSTLMNILGGVFTQDEGTIRLSGKQYNPSCPADATRAGIAFIHQELNLFTNLSVADNLFIDGFPRIGRLPFIDKRRLHKRAAELLSFVDLHVSAGTPVEMLTPGERQLVEIAGALSRDARVIIFDEPTTSLTAAERKRLFDIIKRLQDQGRTIIYISHTLEDVLQVSDAIAVLRDGCLVNTGPVRKYSVDRMIADMVGRRIEQMYPARSTIPGSAAVLEVEGVTQPGIVRDISIKLHEKEVLGIFGLMGSGRSELARIIFGLDSCRTGRISIRGKDATGSSPAASIRKGMAFVTENRHQEGLLMEAAVSENLDLPSLRKFTRLGPARIIDRSRALKFANRIAETLRIKSGPIHTQKVRNLSGGNQQKVVIGKWMLAEPGVLILDEPTRGIDVGAKYEVYGTINKLAEGGVGILYISSELEELTGMCDRILVISNGEIRAEFARPDFDQEKILQAAFSGRAGYRTPSDNSGN